MRQWGERYSERFRMRAVERMSSCSNVSQLARDLHVCRILLYKWRNRLHPVNSPALSQILRQRSREAALRKEIDKLKQLLADKVLEMDFFRTALRKIEARRQSSVASGEQASTMQSVMPLQGSLSVGRMCQWAQVSRAGFYRNLRGQAPNEESMILRSSIQEIALEHRLRYGYRRITMELRHRGMAVNHKRVARMMQEDNLLAVRHAEWLRASGPAYELEIYLNLAKRIKISGTNQLWIADITFVRLKTEFIYLAIVLVEAIVLAVVSVAANQSVLLPDPHASTADPEHVRDLRKGEHPCLAKTIIPRREAIPSLNTGHDARSEWLTLSGL
jgi:putative transposase